MGLEPHAVVLTKSDLGAAVDEGEVKLRHLPAHTGDLLADQALHIGDVLLVHDVLDLGEGKADLLELLDHVERGALFQSVVPVPGLGVYFLGDEQAMLMVDHQCFLRDMIDLCHLAYGKALHENTSYVRTGMKDSL